MKTGNLIALVADGLLSSVSVRKSLRNRLDACNARLAAEVAFREIVLAELDALDALPPRAAVGRPKGKGATTGGITAPRAVADAIESARLRQQIAALRSKAKAMDSASTPPAEPEGI